MNFFIVVLFNVQVIYSFFFLLLFSFALWFLSSSVSHRFHRCMCVYVDQQISDQIQNLTVSSTTSSSGIQQSIGSSSTGKTSEKHSTAASASSNNLNLTNILKDTAATNNVNTANESLAQRVKFLQTKLAHAPMPSITSKRRQLPSIEEAWNLPISAEMSSRQQQTAQSNQQRAYAKNYNHVSNILLHFYSNQIIFSLNRWISCNYCVRVQRNFLRIRIGNLKGIIFSKILIDNGVFA